MSIRDLYEKNITVSLPDGGTATLARMTVRAWAELATRIRDEAMAIEIKAIGGVKDPIMQQTLRMRASQFEPSYYALVDTATTPTGILRILPFAAEKGGTPKEIADQLPDLLSPQQMTAIMSEIIHAPLGPKVGGDLNEGQRPNPTVAESSNQPTGNSEEKPGSVNPSTSTGSESASASDTSTASTPST